MICVALREMRARALESRGEAYALAYTGEEKILEEYFMLL